MKFTEGRIEGTIFQRWVEDATKGINQGNKNTEKNQQTCRKENCRNLLQSQYLHCQLAQMSFSQVREEEI